MDNNDLDNEGNFIYLAPSYARVLINDYKTAKTYGVIWASPPCTTFSPLRRCYIGRFGITAESIEVDIQNLGVPLLRKTEQIIAYFQPKFYFIENGMMSRLKHFIELNPTQFFYSWLLLIWFRLYEEN